MIEMMIGGALVTTGVMIGRFLPNRSRTPKPPKPVCGCKHGLHDHHPKTGVCLAKRTVVTRRDSWGDPIKWHEAPCTCTRYVGPEPLTTIYAPEITG